MSDELAMVEAVLMLEVEPVEEAVLARNARIERKNLIPVLEKLVERYSHEKFGILPVKIADGWTFAPKESLWNRLKERYGRRREDRLSRAALETLSIVAYSQPITRAELENLRGVGSESVLRMLRERNLIADVGRKDAPGRPTLYGTTREFLKNFRLASIADLPKLNDVDQERFA